MKLHSINTEQRLYVIHSGHDRLSCYGFEVLDRKARAVSQWMHGIDPTPQHELGTRTHFEQCASIMAAGALHTARTGARCNAELEPRLIGLEGKRIEVRAPGHEPSRFIVGKSTGWMPCHLEIARRNSSGGAAVYLPENCTIRVLP